MGLGAGVQGYVACVAVCVANRCLFLPLSQPAGDVSNGTSASRTASHPVSLGGSTGLTHHPSQQFLACALRSLWLHHVIINHVKSFFLSSRNEFDL